MILIGNGKIVTRDPANPFIENGAVAIEDKLIKEVGTTDALKAKYSQAQYIDAKGRLVMPGFINTHMHYYSTFARGMSLGGKPATTFGEVLKGLWWRLDKQLTLEDVYYSAIGPMIDEIRSGVTSVIDHHASPFAVTGSLFKIAEAAKLLGIRSNLCYEISDRDGEKIADEGIKENVDFAKYCKSQNDDMIKALIGLHAQVTIGAKTLDKCIAAANDTGVGFHVHAAEGIEDVVDAIAKYDMRVIERLHHFKVLSPKSIAVHCIHVTEGEIELLKDSKVAVVHNPESNMGNAVGVSPVLDMLKKGVLVGLGTDGYTADMTESFKVAGILHKHANRLPSVAWGEPPQMLFENNKTIMERFINGKVGTLKADHYADVIVVDYKGPTPVNADTINSHILFGVTGRHVDTTIINGKIIMQDRVLLNIDEDTLMAKSRELAQKLWKRI
ncbi:MAG: putative aminohydrolase SsnA [Spirochaetaceae bacterium]|jgi:putative selenium metabolism protein SsnA|nr:putative aminohydrolase SsnA [Spirochaetaceae bacterium]